MTEKRTRYVLGLMRERVVNTSGDGTTNTVRNFPIREVTSSFLGVPISKRTKFSLEVGPLEVGGRQVKVVNARGGSEPQTYERRHTRAGSELVGTPDGRSRGYYGGNPLRLLTLGIITGLPLTRRAAGRVAVKDLVEVGYANRKLEPSRRPGFPQTR